MSARTVQQAVRSAGTATRGGAAGAAADPGHDTPAARDSPAAPAYDAPVDSAHPLDNPGFASLNGPHAGFAERRGRVVRYQADVSPWLGVPAEPGAEDWADLAAFAGPEGEVPLPGVAARLPEGWVLTADVPGVQLVDAGIAAAPDGAAVLLGPDDVPEMLDLVARTRPGPFRDRTVELGTYLGIRHRGALVAMAGERLHPPGWTEISAVCTDPAHRGRGLASRLVLAVAHGVRERGETPFLHTAAANTGAIALYESLGFRLRRTVRFRAARVPAVASRGGRSRS
ncbi:GNAT family N-acetyltransferase [Streptomyces silvensis]|uniref:GNAT family N-acetyltransferase n=1 Tax=Streptomyces silvensis TaxID=1765722 RepID=UPI00099E52EC|nr:GNAT family N-acetyltransferase [Streptomyces silvensis]